MTMLLNRILYVEDDPDIQAIVTISLEKIGGFAVKICDLGIKAIEAALEFNPDLILLDIMMPDIDGITILKTLKKHPQLAQIPAIFITAKAQASEIDNYKEIGILDVIIKPFDPMSLPEIINKIWNYRDV